MSMNPNCDDCGGEDAEHCLCARCMLDSAAADQEHAVRAVVDYLRHVASGYAIMRSIKANGARDALHGVAGKLEKDYRAELGSRLSLSNSNATNTNPATIRE